MFRIIRFSRITLISFNSPNSLNFLAVDAGKKAAAIVSRGMVERRSIVKLPFRYSLAMILVSVTSSPFSPVMVVLKMIMISSKKHKSIRELTT